MAGRHRHYPTQQTQK
jgi:hypothetical protein